MWQHAMSTIEDTWNREVEQSVKQIRLKHCSLMCFDCVFSIMLVHQHVWSHASTLPYLFFLLCVFIYDGVFFRNMLTTRHDGMH